MQLGNGTWEKTDFNARLQPTAIALGSTPGTSNLLNLTYEYNTETSGTPNPDNNGNVLKQTITVPSVGVNPGFTGVQTYSYDRFDNVTEYEITNWDVSETESITYTNHRRDGLPSSAYDEEGNRKSGKWLDAAGRNTYFYEGWANLVRVWDGDGREIKRINKVYDFVEEDYLDPDIAYYVRSTVLGGQIITEVDDTGAKAQTYVWAGGSIVARQLMLGEDHDEETVVWDYKDAVRSTTKYLDDEGDDVSTSIDILQSGEYDPKGGFVMPYYFPPNPHAGQTNTRQRVPSPLFELNAGGCTIIIDGVVSSCGLITERSETVSVQVRVGIYTTVHEINRDLPGGIPSVVLPDYDQTMIRYKKATTEEHSGYTTGLAEEVLVEHWIVLDFSWNPRKEQESPPSSPPHHNDCLDFVTEVRKIAASVASPSELMAELWDRYANSSPKDFGATGFRKEFVDPDPNSGSRNQVRHLTGALFVGYRAGSLAYVGSFFVPLTTQPAGRQAALGAALHFFNQREFHYETEYEEISKFGVRGITHRPHVAVSQTPSNIVDVALNNVAIPIGFNLGYGDLDKEGFADAIKSAVCR